MKQIIMTMAILLATVTAGFAQATQDSVHTGHSNQTTEVKKYTCTMHPKVKMYKPGKCPECGMELVPVGKSKAAKKKKSMCCGMGM
ncbi:MAG: hypothetical protein JST86_12650 [Bacteroidetes bacterium]|nr:hypothetical protein [Bacteroidota bacterium]